MCGRIANGTKPGYLRERFDEAAASDMLNDVGLMPRYNVTPGQFLPGIRTRPDKTKEWAVFRWGLIPRWAKPDRIPDRTFNARSETVAEKPTFREAYKHRKCIVPISGYYEWTGEKGAKQPYYFHSKDNDVLVLAGIWETWRHEDTIVDSCTILTTEADKNLERYHHRMPVFLDDELSALWLDNSGSSLELVLNNSHTNNIDIYPVSKDVNNGRVDHEGLITKLPTLL